MGFSGRNSLITPKVELVGNFRPRTFMQAVYEIVGHQCAECWCHGVEHGNVTGIIAEF